MRKDQTNIRDQITNYALRITLYKYLSTLA